MTYRGSYVCRCFLLKTRLLSWQDRSFSHIRSNTLMNGIDGVFHFSLSFIWSNMRVYLNNLQKTTVHTRVLYSVMFVITTEVLDECSECHYYAECVYDDVSQSQRCRCRRGYQGNGTHCEPVDCRDVDMCDTSANCEQDSNGYYACVCRPGYRGEFPW